MEVQKIIDLNRLGEKADRIIELLERIAMAVTINQVSESPLHYFLPGDPEPISQPEFNPMTPDDQAAVERWKADCNDLTDYRTEQLESEVARIQVEIDRRKSNA